MSQIIVSELAKEKIMSDPRFQAIREGRNAEIVPLLYYYQRSYSTLHDGTTIEHGDGFMLSFVSRKDAQETEDIEYKLASVEGVNILVGGPRSVLAGILNIGYVNTKFTLGREKS